MKRIYMTLALLGAAVSGAFAQDGVDLLVFPVIDSNYNMPPTGKPFSLTGVFEAGVPGGDSVTATVIYAVGPESMLLTGEQAWFIAPDATLSDSGFVSGWVYTAPEDIVGDGELAMPFALSANGLPISDSIRTLLNIENFEADSSFFVDLLVKRSALVVGNTYGWYGHVRPWPSGAYVDSNGAFEYIPIVWGGSGTSLPELVKNTKYTPLEIFPNPTTDNVNFELEFADANKSTIARVLAINGRVVSTTNFGKTAPGTRKHSVDVSSLPAGMYSLQVITDHAISVEKFVKK